MQATHPFSSGLALALVILLVIEILAGFIGNFKVCLLLYKRKELRKVPHILLGHLSIIGLLVSITMAPVLLSIVVFAQYAHRAAPPAACIFKYSSSLFFLVLNSLTLVAMAIDRQDCVLQPFKRRLTPANIKKVIAGIIVVASGLTLGHLPLAYQDLKDGCTLYAFKKNASIYYIIVAANANMFATAFVIFMTFVRVVKKLRSSQFTAQSNQRAEARVTKFSLGLMAVYLLSFLPLVVFTFAISAAGITGAQAEGLKIFILTISNLNYVVTPFLHAQICKNARRVVAPIK